MPSKGVELKPEPVFNPRKRRVARSKIPFAELISSVTILVFLSAIILWVLLQRNSFDPAYRDLPEELLNTGIVEAKIYHTPLQSWLEPNNSSASPVIELGYLPKEILSNAWNISARLKEFNEETLFEKINGEADKFLQHGFQLLQFVRITNPGKTAEIGIELFDQGNLAGSLGIFAEYLSAAADVQTTDGVVYIMNKAGAIARKGRFFARIIGDQESQIIVDQAKLIAESLNALPENKDEIPFEYKFLTSQMGINPAFIAFQSKNVFQFDFAKDFWFGSPLPKNAGRFFIHSAETETEIQKLYKNLLEEQQYDYSIERDSGSLAVLQHQFLKTWFVLKIEGSVIIGVEKMADLELAQRMIRQASDSLASESGYE